MAASVLVKLVCSVPDCHADSLVFLNGTPLCTGHYCQALQALEAIGGRPTTFGGDALELILLQRIREDVVAPE
jgi:hypothetical protein